MSEGQDSPNASLGASIAEGFRHSLASLKNLIALLYKDSTQSAQAMAVLTKAFEEYGRLRTWGEENRATLPTESRGSLDESLRKEPILKGLVIDIVAKITRQAEDAIRIAQLITDNNATWHELSSNTDQGEDTESSSEGEEWGIYDGQQSRKPAVWRSLRRMEEDIRSLFQVSLMIMRPGFDRRYIHSTEQKPWDPRVAHYVEFDLRHIEEKIQYWKGIHLHVEEDSVATLEKLQQRQDSTDISGSLACLIQRLARGNTKRREQIFYWSKFPDRAPVPVEVASPTETIPIIRTDGFQKTDDNEPNDDPQIPKTVPTQDTESRAPRSIASRQTFSTVVVSDVFGPRTVAGPARTIYADSTLGRRNSNRVPNVPMPSLHGRTFECPYCHLDLDSTLMQDRQEWKRHVFRDLRPYVCTFAECQNPDKQYQTRHDWIYHEMQMHRRKWVCEEHEIGFSSPSCFVEHISTAHASSVSQQQIAVLVELSERPCDEMEIHPCPLCPEERRLNILRAHIAEHLETLALFALPGNAGVQEESNNNDGDVSRRTADEIPFSRDDESEASKAWSQRKSEDHSSHISNPPISNIETPDSYGLKLVCEPQNNSLEPDVDIIFVQGLSGSPEASWSLESKDGLFFWPQRLPQSLGTHTARILTFSYAFTKGYSPNLRELLREKAFRLWEMIKRSRNRGAFEKRPIIFIAHSLGGLLVKEVYLLAMNDAACDSISVIMKGMIFVATPHLITNRILDRIMNAWIVREPEQIVRTAMSVRPLREINKRFQQFSSRLKISSFYETRSTEVTPKKVREMVLERESSVIGQADEKSSALDADHHGICKFSGPGDPNYVAISYGVRVMIDQLKQQASDEYAKLRTCLGTEDIPLAFRNDVHYWPYPVTFEWIWHVSAIQEWFNSRESRIAWLHGPIGSGKSAVAAFIRKRIANDHFCVHIPLRRFHKQFGNSFGQDLKFLLDLTAYRIPSLVTELLTRTTKATPGPHSDFMSEEQDAQEIWQNLYEGAFFKISTQVVHWIIDDIDDMKQPELFISMLRNLAISQTQIKVLFLGRYMAKISEAFEQLAKQGLTVGIMNMADHLSSTRESLMTHLLVQITTLPCSEKQRPAIDRIIASFIAGTMLKDDISNIAKISRNIAEVDNLRTEEAIRTWIEMWESRRTEEPPRTTSSPSNESRVEPQQAPTDHTQDSGRPVPPSIEPESSGRGKLHDTQLRNTDQPTLDDLAILRSRLGLDRECKGFTMDHQIYEPYRAPRTLSWIFEDHFFNEWLHSQTASVAWLYGSKSFRDMNALAAAAFITDTLQNQSRLRGHYVYLHIKASARSWEGSPLATTLKLLLLLSAQKYPDIGAAVLARPEQETYDDPKEIWNRLFIGTLFKMRTEVPMYLIISGLEGLDDSALLIEMLKAISASMACIKVLLSSRFDHTVKAALDVLGSTVPVTQLDVSSRIELEREEYIERKLEGSHFGTKVRKRTIRELLGIWRGAVLKYPNESGWDPLGDAITELLQCDTDEAGMNWLHGRGEWPRDGG